MKTFSPRIRALSSLLFGNRAKQFDIYLEKLPAPQKFLEILRKNNFQKIENLIFDLDGTLVPEYGQVTEQTIATLQNFGKHFKNIIIFTNSSKSHRFKILADNGFAPYPTVHPKPDIRGFQSLCIKHKLDPQKTAMVGNFAITDAPLAEQKFLAANIILSSIPPTKQTLESGKTMFAARVIQALSRIALSILKLKNPGIFHP